MEEKQHNQVTLLLTILTLCGVYFEDTQIYGLYGGINTGELLPCHIFKKTWIPHLMWI